MVNCNPKHRYNRCDKCKWNRHGMRAVTDYFEIYTISSFMKKKFETNFMISRALCKVEQSKQNKNKNYFSPDFLEMVTFLTGKCFFQISFQNFFIQFFFHFFLFKFFFHQSIKNNHFKIDIKIIFLPTSLKWPHSLHVNFFFKFLSKIFLFNFFFLIFL